MKYSNTVEYNIKTSLDSKGLTQLKSELQGLELKLQNMGNKGLLDEKTFVDARNQIQGLGQALSDAFNPSLGMLDLSKLNQELKNNDVTAQGLKTAFSSLGAEGQVAFNNLVGELGKLDTGILRTNSQIDKLFTTFSNTFRWGLVSSFFSQFMNAIHSSVDYVKELDDSLTQIMLVTDYNRDSMNEFAKSANEAAKAVSMTTTGMTNASLIFAQQGYDLGQSQELATLSAKLANASQQDTATTSDQITAYMNAYGLQDSMEELTQQMDNWAKIANVSAADVGELAQASQRAASMANTVGVSGEALAAQIATIESVTREAPEQIGNGLKTLYARFSDISGGGKDEDGVDLGKVTAQLDAIGVKVLDQFGNIRTMDDIMEDLMDVWADLDDTAKIAAAQSLAGKYQVNRFVALMDNRDMYEEYIGATGSSATGTLDQMNEEFADSIEGRSAKLQASLEGLFSTIFNTDDIYPWMDAAQGAIDLLQQFFDALGGGKTILLGISSLLMQVFSKNMAQEINNAATNRAVQQQKLENLQNSQAALTTLGVANPNPNDANSQNILNFAQYMQANAKNFNAEQMNQANSILQELVQNSNAATMAADKLKDSLSVIGTGITVTTGESILAPFLDSEGAVNATLLSEALQNMSQSEIADMFSHIQEDIKPAREGLLEFNKALQDYQQELRKTDSTDDSWNQSLNNLKATLLNLKDYIDPATYERYEQAVNEISQVTENAGDKTAETTAEVAKLADGLEKVAAKDLTNLNQLNNDAFQAKNTQMAAEDSNKVAGAFQKGMDSQAQIQGILNTLNAVQQLTFAWQAFQNLGSIWSNSNLSEGEKLLQTIMVLGTALPSVITAVQTLQTTMDGLIAKDKEWIAQTLEAPQKAIDQAQSEREAMQAIYEKAEANLFAAQSELSNAEAEVNGIEIVLRAIDAQIAYTKSIYETAKAKAIANNDSIKLAQLEAQETASIAKLQADRVKAETALAGAKEKVTAAQMKVTEAQQRTQAASAALSAAFMGVNTAMSAYSGAMLIATNRTEGLSAALTFLEKHPVIIALAAIAMAATTIFGIIKAQAEEAKQEAQAAFDETKSRLEQIQSLQDQVSSFREKFESQKNAGNGFEGLADEARNVADAFEAAGDASSANALRLEIARTEAQGTEQAYERLTNRISDFQTQAEANINTETWEKGLELLKANNVTLDEIIMKHQLLADAKEQLAKAEAQGQDTSQIKDYIAHLEEEIEAYGELNNVYKDIQSSAMDLAAQQIAAAEGQNMHVFKPQDAATERAGTEALTPGAMNWSSIDQYLKEVVPGYAEIADEAERAALAHEHMATEAGKAAVEVGQLLLANQSLDDSPTTRMMRDSDGYTFQQTSIGREGIQTEMSDAGLDHEQQVRFLATLDENASESEILSALEKLKQNMENGDNFNIALKGSVDPEQFEQSIKEQINSYQPTDEDVDADQFKSMANYLHEADDSVFEEGGMFEGISSDIQDNVEAIEDLIEGILRYDDAVSTLQEKESDWRDALSDSADFEKRATAVSELQETYSDFLDLGDDVSKTFAENADNLDLMAEAAAGDTDAYNELLAAASEDIAVHIYGIDETSQDLQTISTYLQSDAFKDIEVGMSLDPEDEAGFYTALNNMIAQGNWTRQDLDSYLKDIDCSLDPSGIEEGLTEAQQAAIEAGQTIPEETTYTTTAETNTVQNEDTKEATSLDVKEIPGETWTADVPTVTVQTAGMPAATSVPIHGTVPPSFEVTAKPIKSVDTTEASGSSMKTEKGGDGKFHVKNGSIKKNNSGGTKHNNASSPHVSSPGGSCFIAGTLVTTLTGFKPIEKIQKGDIVLSYNEKIKVNEYSEVLQTMIHDTIEPIYTLHIKDEQLRVTGIHRFLVIDKITCRVPQWVHATDLKVGNWIMFADGSWHVIYKIDINIEHRTVYNFEVSHNHNYYVGRNQILAHNKSGGKKSCFVAGTQISTINGFRVIESIQLNDIVLSYNEQTKCNEYSSVVQTMIHDTKEPIYTLYIQNEQLRVTGIHRFLVTNNIVNGISEWIAAENLRVGQWVLFADGTWHVIHKIKVNIEQQTVYNFEVSGNHNYYVGCSQILAHNKSSGGKKGGGGGKAKTIEQKEKKEHKKDYYEEVSNQLEKTEKILSKIEKEEDRLIGDKARANQNKQLTLLQKEIDLNNKKLTIQEQELKDVDVLIKKRDKLAEKTAAKQGVIALIPDIQLDEDKIISNYEEISKAIDDTHNKLIEKYNAAAKAKNEDLTKEIQKTIDEFDKYGEDLLKQAQRHNKLQSEIEETKATLEDLEDQIEDIRIDAYKAAQEALDNLKEIKESAAELDKLFRDFDKNNLSMNRWSVDDTPYGDLIETLSKLDNMYSVTAEDARKFYDDLITEKENAKANTTDEDELKAIQNSIDFFTAQRDRLSNDDTLQNGLLGLAQQDLAQLQKWMDNPAAEDNVFGENTAALFEAYQDAYKRTLEYYKDYRELVKDTRDSIIDIYDEAADSIERQVDQYDRVIEKIERISDKYSLFYGEDSYDQLDQFYAKQGEVAQNRLNLLTQAADYWKQQLEKANDTGNEALIEAIQDKVDEAEDAMLDAAEELAELWVEKFENAVEASSQHIFKDLFGSNDIDELTDNWELQKDYMERYKDDVEKAYEVDKLRNKYLDLLDEAQGSSLQTQNRIRQQMQEQLDLLNNQKTVTEYDVKLANAKLEILQKQMALEDAQRNKNKMQLRRDTQGNYRYIYTADQGNVREAQQDLEDSQYDAYEMTKQETVSNNDRAINLLQDYVEKRANIWNKYKDDSTERAKALAELEAEYQKHFDALAEDFSDTSQAMLDILNWTIENGTDNTVAAATDMLNKLYDENGRIKDQTGVDWMDLANLIQDEIIPNIEDAVTKADLEMQDQAIELKDAMTGPNGALTAMGAGADDLANSMDKAAEATRGLATATNELFDAFGADNKKLNDALSKLSEYEDQLKATQSTTSQLGTQLRKANSTIAAKTTEARNYQTLFDLSTGAKNFEKGNVVTIKAGTWVWYDRTGTTHKDTEGKYGFVVNEDTKVRLGETQEQINGKLASHHIALYPTDTKTWGKVDHDEHNEATRRQQYWHLSADELRKALTYDTGGYTGEWQDQTADSKNGKLAVLHQKELILNTTDTQNILAAVTLMRDMTKGSILGLSNIGKIIPTGLSSNVYGSTTEQRVEIQASFPNATDAEDIRAALLGLSDSAYQYAHRTI